MRFIVLLLLVGAMFLPACGRQNGNEGGEYEAPDFPEKVDLSIIPINRDLLLGNIMNIELVDSLVILKGRNVDNDKVFHAVTIDGGRMVGSFCTYGRSENESVDYMRISFNKERTHMLVVDNADKILGVDLAKAVSGDKDFVEYTGRTPSPSHSRYVHFLSRDSLLHVECFKNRHLITDRWMMDTLARYNDYPSIDRTQLNNMEPWYYFASNSYSAVKPDRTRFAITTHYGMLLEVFGIGNEGITSVSQRKFFIPKMRNEIAPAEDCICGATGMYATDKYIYVLFNDTTKIDYPHRHLGVFDWNGDEVMVCDFGEMIHQFAVTPDDTRAYCWVQDAGGEEYLGYFDLIEN